MVTLLPVLVRALSGRDGRPLALVGASGTGKTTFLRTSFAALGAEPCWTTALGVTDRLVSAIRGANLREGWDSLLADPRPLVVEHLEDLRETEVTLRELQRLFEARIAAGRAVVLTVTAGRGTGGLLRWLRRCADVVEVSRCDA